MDGNGRWATSRQLPRVEGHRAGAGSVRTIVEESRRLGIRYLTLFAFSSENWRRPAAEVAALMLLFRQYLRSETKLLIKHAIRLRIIGNRDLLPRSLRRAFEEVEQLTKDLDGMDLVLALSYGGREEIVSAAQSVARKVAAGEIQPDDITADIFRSGLYSPDIPDPDLLIRTSDEMRISNFLLWQLAYSEIIVSKVCWPDFSRDEFRRCLEEYTGRERRFGLTGEQLQQLRA